MFPLFGRKERCQVRLFCPSFVLATTKQRYLTPFALTAPFRRAGARSRFLPPVTRHRGEGPPRRVAASKSGDESPHSERQALHPDPWFPQVNTQLTDASIYVSTAASRLPPQDSRPGGSLLPSCETLSFSTANPWRPGGKQSDLPIQTPCLRMCVAADWSSKGRE